MKYLKLLAFIFIFLLFGTVSSQYYYFDSGGNTYQQGCSEKLNIRINTKGKKVRAGRFHLVLDPFTTFYEKTGNVDYLRTLFAASSITFEDWTSNATPSWQNGSNYTILQADRSSTNIGYVGTTGLYAIINFKPQYNTEIYDIQFGMEYFPTSDTVETTLSSGGDEVINPAQQNLYRTGTYPVLQEPCVDDKNKPLISNFSIQSGATKIRYENGITLKLLDNTGSGGNYVPYIWKNGVWTGNNENINNQYGINSGTFRLNVSCTNCNNGGARRVTITNQNSNFVPNGKTWQDLDRNYDVNILSGALFDFGIEKTITITGVVQDRKSNTSSQLNIVFNRPKGPTLISGSRNPRADDQYRNLSDPVILGIQDDWAGVNSGSIRITLSGVNGTDYGPYVFTGEKLNLSGVDGEALTPDYMIEILDHEPFPINATINVSVYARDNEGNIDTINDYVFGTRPSCAELQCCDPIEIRIMSGDSVWRRYTYTGDILYINGPIETTTGYIDTQDWTGYVFCNGQADGLDISIRGEYQGFTSRGVLDLLGTGVKGTISGEDLILSLLIDEISLIGDTPYSGQVLSGTDVNFAWHTSGMDDISFISGYFVSVCADESCNTIVKTGYSDVQTLLIHDFEDGKYFWKVQAEDVMGNLSLESDLIPFEVDNEAPTCDIVLEPDTCTAGDVTLRIVATGAVGYSWTGYDDFVSENIEKVVSDNGTYRCFVVDVAGNVGTNSKDVDNIDKGVIGSPKDLTSPDGPITINPRPQFIWTGVNNNGCRTLSGYEITICKGDAIAGGTDCHTYEVNTTGYIPTSDLEDGTYVSVVVAVDNLGGKSENSNEYVIIIDHTAPIFDFDDNSGYECETGSVEIKNVSDFNLLSEPYSFDGINFVSNAVFDVAPIRTIGDVYVTGYVKDRAGNLSNKVAKYTFIDTGVVAQNFTGSDNVGQGASVDRKQQSHANEGNCGNDDLQAQVISNGSIGSCIVQGDTLLYIPNLGAEGNDVCRLKISDNEGNSVDVDVYRGGVHGAAELMCIVSYSPISGSWTSGNVVATATLNGTGIWTSQGGNTHTFVENGTWIFEFSGELNTGSCEGNVWRNDTQDPSFDFGGDMSGYECETGFIELTNIVDTGAGVIEGKYGFDGVWYSMNRYYVFMWTVGEKIVTGSLQDRAGNIVEKQGKYTFIDTGIFAHDFTVPVGNGVSVDWMVRSDVREGNCGTGYLIGTILSTGEKGTCEITGKNILTYTPINTGVTGNDTCSILVADDEGTTGEIVVTFTDINAKYSVELKSPSDGATVNGCSNINFVWGLTGNNTSNLAISGYVYNVGTNVGFTKTTGVSLNLQGGNYNWNVYIVYEDGSTGGMSDTWVVHVNRGSCGGGGGGITKDKCPGGDDSPSYYDGTCAGDHSSPTDICGVNESNYSDEQKLAYLYSYVYQITTMCPIEEADIDGYLQRDHFAKMISNYAINIVGKKPDLNKPGCDAFDDIYDDTVEMKHYIKLACQLNLMGMHADGHTVKQSFDPYDILTRAEFGTVFSRLLFGSTYNIENESAVYKNEGYWYKNHLQALKDHGIMNQIDGDWPMTKERRGRVMLMLARADDYGVFRGFSPAKNGITALFVGK